MIDPALAEGGAIGRAAVLAMLAARISKKKPEGLVDKQPDPSTLTGSTWGPTTETGAKMHWSQLPARARGSRRRN